MVPFNGAPRMEKNSNSRGRKRMSGTSSTGLVARAIPHLRAYAKVEPSEEWHLKPSQTGVPWAEAITVAVGVRAGAHVELEASSRRGAHASKDLYCVTAA